MTIRGGIYMAQYTYLKLLAAGFTTLQIYKIIAFAPHFLEASKEEQSVILNQFVRRHHSKVLSTAVTLFNKLYVEKIIEKLAMDKVNFISINDNCYPRLLREIATPPVILYYRGNVKLLNYVSLLGVIGSRNATGYTDQALHYLYPAFSQHKIGIVSGLAKGADHSALKLALQYDLPAVAVLAFGHCRHYPAITRTTRNQLEQHGLVISEYPPQTPIKKYYFPQRNRLISGISKGVLITESEMHSGTHITLECALDQNREVYVIPGRFYDQLSEGNMIAAQQGAKIVMKPEDIIEDFKLTI
jgi:DNA processing protein